MPIPSQKRKKAYFDALRHLRACVRVPLGGGKKIPPVLPFPSRSDLYSRSTSTLRRRVQPPSKRPSMEAAAAAAATSVSVAGGRGRDEKTQPRPAAPAAAAAACAVEALRRCLEENKGDRVKCQAHIDAFRSSCSAGPSTSSKLQSSS